MDINVRGKNIEINQTLRSFIDKKAGKLQRYFNNLSTVDVVLAKEKNGRIAEITVPIDGMVLRSEGRNEDMYTSIDLAVEKLERQINKHKAKLYQRFRTGEHKVSMGQVFSDMENEPMQTFDELVKIKRFPIKPMNTEEAAMQMDLLGHDFFVFISDETEQTNVIYRRKDGKYGLLEPDVG